MAIALGTITPVAFNSGATSFATSAHNYAGGTDALLLVILIARSRYNGLTYTASVTWNGTALTQAVPFPAAAGITTNDLLFWAGHLRGATTGARQLAITTSQRADGMAVWLINLTGVDQSNPIGAAGQNETTAVSATATHSITTLGANSLVFAGCGTVKILNQPTLSSGWTHRSTVQFSADVDDRPVRPIPGTLASQVRATAGSVSCTATWSNASDRQVMGLIEVREAAGAPPPPPPGGTTDRDHGVFGVGAITGADADMGIFLRQDQIGDSSGEDDVYVASASFGGGRYRVESQPNAASTGNDRAIDLVAMSSAGIAMYLNGAPATASFKTAPIPSGALRVPSGTLWVGAATKDASTGGWIGLIDELRFKAADTTPEMIADERAQQTLPREFYGLGDDDSFGSSQSPVAVPVEASVPSGQSSDIDVLARVINPGGGTLTLNSVGQPTNGSAAVVGGKVRYQSNAGFEGTDKCSYSIGGVGKLSTGRIIITVAPPIVGGVGYDTGDIEASRLPTMTGTTRDISQLSSAQAGDHVVVTSAFTGARTVPAGVVLRPSTLLGVTLNNPDITLGNDAVLYGFRITGENSYVNMNGHRSKVLRCAFSGHGTVAPLSAGDENVGAMQIQIYGNDCQIRCCSFSGEAGRTVCHRVLASATTTSKRLTVAHCHFMTNRSSGGQARECIQLSLSGLSSGRSASDLTNVEDLVKYCFFDRIVYEQAGSQENEIISFKSSDNTVRNCLFQDCTEGSYCTMRIGDRNAIIGTRFVRSDGPQIVGNGWRVISTTVDSNGAFRIQEGDGTGLVNPVHPVPENGLIAFSTGSVILGNSYGISPRNNKHWRHTGTISAPGFTAATSVDSSVVDTPYVTFPYGTNALL